MGIDWNEVFPKPERDDNSAAKRWRGALFWDLPIPLMWKDAKKGYYEHLEAPHSVTFPICECCRHVIWDWPHYEEEVPEHACCEACGEEEDNNSWIEED